MAETADISSWILLIFGIYSFAAGVGELRRPGMWARMMWEIEQSNGLQFLTGIFCIVCGRSHLSCEPLEPAGYRLHTGDRAGRMDIDRGRAIFGFWRCVLFVSLAR